MIRLQLGLAAISADRFSDIEIWLKNCSDTYYAPLTDIYNIRFWPILAPPEKTLMLRPLLLLLLVAANSQPANAFMGFFEPAAPEVAIEYNDQDCGSRGGIKLTIRNPTTEALAKFRLTVTIFRPESSRIAAKFNYGTDRVIPAKSALYFCTGVPQNQFSAVLSAKHPDLDYFSLSSKYRNLTNVQPDAMLSGAILKVELVDYEYGLPY